MKHIISYKNTIITAIAIGGLSGCVSDSQVVHLQNQNTRQSQIIRQQQQQIIKLKKQLQAKQLQQKRLQTKQVKQGLKSKSKAKQKSANKHTSTLYSKPKKSIKLKKVEDTNYNSDYMYPSDKKPLRPKTAVKTLAMNKTECIGMIGEAKYKHYTQMFGSEAAAIKRCAMIRAMKK